MRIYIIAGETSGDFLGSQLMEELSKSNTISFFGIGGPCMEAQGLTSLFPMRDLSLMGLVEIIKHLPRLYRRIRQTIADIEAVQPDILLTIDAPDFCHRISKKTKKKHPHIKIVHYVAPSVWAWRPGRAKVVARFLDHLFCLLPFEPAYFTKHGLPATFVGHSICSKQMREESIIHKKGTIPILVLPGSRVSEITRLWPIFYQTCQSLYVRDKNHRFFVPIFEEFKHLYTNPDQLPITFVDQKDKDVLFTPLMRGALAASGTVSLELAHAGIPMVVAYKMSKLTGILGRFLVHTPWVCLVNILLNKSVVPELLQEKCTAHNLTQAMTHILQEDENQKQRAALKQAIDCLKTEKNSSQICIEILQKMVKVTLFALCLHSVHAVVGVPETTPQDLQRLAYKEDIFQSACLMADEKANIRQTGVLISPQMVMTAAHGVAHLLKARGIEKYPDSKRIPVIQVYVSFRQKNGDNVRVRVTHVVVDPRYLGNEPGLETKFDIGLLILETPVANIPTASIEGNVKISLEEPAYVVSYGPALPIGTQAPTAFALTEFDVYHAHPFDVELLHSSRSVLYGSLFPNFKDAPAQKPSQMATESEIRHYEAKSIWKKNGRPPVALAQPGTSGAPVFMRDLISGKYVLVGIVTSYAPLQDSRDKIQKPYGETIARDPKAALGHFQTIFTLVLREQNELGVSTSQKKLKTDAQIIEATKP